jgi:hypothetical protein
VVVFGFGFRPSCGAGDLFVALRIARISLKRTPPGQGRAETEGPGRLFQSLLRRVPRRAGAGQEPGGHRGALRNRELLQGQDQSLRGHLRIRAPARAAPRGGQQHGDDFTKFGKKIAAWLNRALKSLRLVAISIDSEGGVLDGTALQAMILDMEQQMRKRNDRINGLSPPKKQPW